MTLSIKNSQDKLLIRNEIVKKIACSILEEYGISRYRICIAFLDNVQISQLNKRFLGHDCPTDVLAFPYQTASRNSKKLLCADIAISTEETLNNSRAFNTSVAEELGLYIIHGLLHLLGFDDSSKSRERLMRKEEQRWLTRFKGLLGELIAHGNL